MDTHTKKLFSALFFAAILALLLSQTPKVYSAELTSPEIAVTFLTDVVELDMARYDAELVSNVHYPSNLASRFDEEVTYRLKSAESTLEAACHFKNKSVVACKLYPSDGSPRFNKPSADSVLDRTREFLQKYQTFSEASYVQPMRNIFDLITELETMTTTLGNVKLVVENSVQVLQRQDQSIFSMSSTYIDLIYTVNGLDFGPKNMHLTFKNGTFVEFWDYWNRYQVGTTEVNISKEDAVSIAKETLRGYSYKVGDITASNFTFVDSPLSVEFSMQPRENNTLYPWYDIRLNLDKLFPGMVSSFQVTLWADTGEVTHIVPISGGGGSVEENSLAPTALPSLETPAEVSDSPLPSPTESLTSMNGSTENAANSIGTYAVAAVAVLTVAVLIVAVALKKRSI